MPKVVVKRKCVVLTLQQKVDICNRLEKGVNRKILTDEYYERVSEGGGSSIVLPPSSTLHHHLLFRTNSVTNVYFLLKWKHNTLLFHNHFRHDERLNSGDTGV